MIVLATRIAAAPCQCLCWRSGVDWAHDSVFCQPADRTEEDIQPFSEFLGRSSFVPLPTAQCTGIYAQALSYFPLSEAEHTTPEHDSLAQSLGLSIIGYVPQELDDPGQEAELR